MCFARIVSCVTYLRTKYEILDDPNDDLCSTPGPKPFLLKPSEDWIA